MRSHLKTVYVYLTMSVLSATAGAYLHMVNGLFWNFGLLGALASMGLVMGLHFTPDNGKNRGQRTAMLLGFAFLSGTLIFRLTADGPSRFHRMACSEEVQISLHLLPYIGQLCPFSSLAPPKPK